jgi:hypothetical protein
MPKSIKYYKNFINNNRLFSLSRQERQAERYHNDKTKLLNELSEYVFENYHHIKNIKKYALEIIETFNNSYKYYDIGNKASFLTFFNNLLVKKIGQSQKEEYEIERYGYKQKKDEQSQEYESEQHKQEQACNNKKTLQRIDKPIEDANCILADVIKDEKSVNPASVTSIEKKQINNLIEKILKTTRSNPKMLRDLLTIKYFQEDEKEYYPFMSQEIINADELPSQRDICAKYGVSEQSASRSMRIFTTLLKQEYN